MPDNPYSPQNIGNPYSPYNVAHPESPTSGYNINNPSNPNSPNNPANPNSPLNPSNQPYSGENIANPYSPYNLRHPESPNSALNISNPSNPANRRPAPIATPERDAPDARPHYVNGLFGLLEGDHARIAYVRNGRQVECTLDADCPRSVYAAVAQTAPAGAPDDEAPASARRPHGRRTPH